MKFDTGFSLHRSTPIIVVGLQVLLSGRETRIMSRFSMHGMKKRILRWIFRVGIMNGSGGAETMA
ncbi:hypothetical protein L195_g025602 [Trifolium pratense]|uniref:Uncharacterized protein n=1 Tax=Trifolium pratense TaxID=57577 RepID=A0A2K3NH00_TRIPR|nr:hypothetical protein L195_g025602 [Trifolium pratense]